jgi:hypothetical protein
MLTGLEILLARMKTNPEEFLAEGRVPHDGEIFGGKWSDLFDYAWRVSTEDERAMIQEARKEFLRDDFNERVFKRLAGEETKQDTMKIKITERYATGHADPRGGLFGAGGILNANTQTVGSQPLEGYEQQMARYAQTQDDAMRQSKTLFGGLGAGKNGLLGWW